MQNYTNYVLMYTFTAVAPLRDNQRRTVLAVLITCLLKIHFQYKASQKMMATAEKLTDIILFLLN